VKRVTYAGDSFATGDAIADAMLDYATVLARANVADHVVVPGLARDGSTTRFDVVIGPASQLIAEHVEGLGDELVDEAFVAEMTRRSRLAAAGRVDQVGDATGPHAAT
jgi:hypothetical protein